MIRFRSIRSSSPFHCICCATWMAIHIWWTRGFPLYQRLVPNNKQWRRKRQCLGGALTIIVPGFSLVSSHFFRRRLGRIKGGGNLYNILEKASPAELLCHYPHTVSYEHHHHLSLFAITSPYLDPYHQTYLRPVQSHVLLYPLLLFVLLLQGLGSDDIIRTTSKTRCFVYRHVWSVRLK